MGDQAEKLRERINNIIRHDTQPRKTRVITITSGKGGVGKSNFSLNFALSLIKQNKKVLIFDVDVGLANIDVLMGLSSRKNILQMMDQDLSIWDIIEEGAHGLQVIAGGSGFTQLFQLNEEKLSRFFDQLSALQGHFDYIILDTGAGLSTESIRYILAADDVILVTTPEPTSYTDAYAVIKMVHVYDPNLLPKLVINRCSTIQEGRQTFNKLHLVANQFLHKQISCLGLIPDDSKVIQAVKKQTPFLLEFPDSKASLAIREITASFLNISLEKETGIKSFLRKMFNKIGP